MAPRRSTARRSSPWNWSPGGTLHERVKAGGPLPVARGGGCDPANHRRPRSRARRGHPASRHQAVELFHRARRHGEGRRLRPVDLDALARRLRAHARRLDPRHAGVFVARATARRRARRALGHLFGRRDALLSAHRARRRSRRRTWCSCSRRCSTKPRPRRASSARRFPRRSRASSCAASRSRRATASRATTNCARALLPFTSTAPTPATLGLRFVAGVIDQIAFMIVNLIGCRCCSSAGDARLACRQIAAAVHDARIWSPARIVLLSSRSPTSPCPKAAGARRRARRSSACASAGSIAMRPASRGRCSGASFTWCRTILDAPVLPHGRGSTESMAWNFAFGAARSGSIPRCSA